MVPSVGALILVFLSFLILSTLVNFFHKMWWVPTRVKRIMTRQGIKGPPYHFIHGNTKEIAAMKEQANITRFTEISHDIYPRIQPHFFTWFQLYGWEKLSGLVWSQAELVITEPDIIREIANNHRATFARPDLGSYNKKILGDGLVTSSGKKWASQRKLANHVFNAMVASVELMLNRWKKMDSNEVEMNAEFRMLAAEVISRTAFGSNYLQGKEVFEMLKEMGTIAGRNYYNPRHLGLLGKIVKSNDDLKSDELQKRIHNVIIKTVKEREKTMGHEDADNTDFLGQLLLSKNNIINSQGYQLSTQDIIDECKTFYVSGDGTTSLLLSWAVLLLSIYTEWQERAREEVFQIFGKETQPHFEGLAKLKIIGMIIHETLRLYPPGIAIIRKNEREVKLGNLIVPANIILHVPVLALHHDYDIWGGDAHLFKPERFSQGVSNATKNNPSAYMPFGFGPRNCVGSNFATNTAKVTLAMMLQHYRFSPSPNYVHLPVHITMLVPKNGVQVMLHALK
ncbi:putative 11-oxo-beta-amyrin 30-oxidase [Helianthus annuus]|uniref:11-oxo-beta-amyrin 30-oxidase n=1 Tax=Helianthus annuus TaxID=4232 RepID=A0A9K3DJR9_HELAN|nr:putative 11-oxo-beta-amyrin 30-oxidase [Helianthus annuus]KAJ0813130.1 putative 11-oxo-beta-amyrin 30-oxidase [Helianthus annuus]